MKNDETLILYHQNLCGFCWSVRDVIDQLEVQVELRDIFEDRSHGQELQEATGRGVVPVLRRIDPDGNSEWMPESSDIIRYLSETYG